MKIVEVCDFFNTNILSTPDINSCWLEVKTSIEATDWPHGSGKFTIYPESGKKAGQGNGVKPIKIPCLNMLSSYGWSLEAKAPSGSNVLKTGDLDAVKTTVSGEILFEWETGNISSSHRAINKLLITMQECDNVICAYLVVPSKSLKVFLTDRIGNIDELRPYFPLWERMNIPHACLRIIVIEHDSTSSTSPRIPKGTDGRSLR